MTPAEMVDALNNILVGVPDDRANEALVAGSAIADELSRSCAGCKHWNDGSDGMRADCVLVVESGPSIIDMPADGSGYCRPGWEAK
jgi:hypothetical protein